MSRAAPPQSESSAPTFLPSALALLGLASFAVGQPVLELVGAKPEFFAVRRSLPIDILLLALLLCAGPAFLAIGVEYLAKRFRPTWLAGLHAVFIAFFAALIALPPVNRSLDADSPLAPLLLASSFGVAVAAVNRRFEAARWILAFLACGLLIFPLVFTLRPGVFKLLTQDNTQITAIATEPPAIPVVLLVFDELPLSSLLDTPDSIDAIRYPSFAALAGQATWYRNAATVADFTVQAVPSIFTGRYPRPEQLPISTDHPNSLMTLLGYPTTTNISESVTDLCPASVCHQDAGQGFFSRQRSLWRDVGILYLHMLAPADMASSLPAIHQNWVLFQDKADWLSDWRVRDKGDREKQVEEFLEGLVPSSRGSLHILHVLLPHGPFEFLPSGRRYSIYGSPPGKPAVTPADWAGAIEGYQRHLLQLGYTDRILGRIINRLEAADLYDRSLFIVTADHGANFLHLAEQRRHLRDSTGAEILPIPLLIKAPGQRHPAVDLRLVESVDILPTIADHAGVSIPWPVDGLSLVGAGPLRDEMTFFRHQEGAQERLQIAPERLNLEEILRVKAEWLGTGAEMGQPYRLKPDLSLIGRAVADLPSAPASQLVRELELPQQAIYLDADPAFVPSHLVGRLGTADGHPAHPVRIAVAVNGRVEAVGQTRGGDKPGTFSILIDEDVYRSGDNRLALFEVLDGADGSRLAPLGPEISSQEAQSVDLLFESSLKVLGIEAAGLYNLEEWPEIGKIRWTTDRTEIRVPERLAQRVQGLRLDVASTGPDGTRLRILVNGRKVLSQKLDRLPEDRLVPIRVELEELQAGDLILVLETKAFVPHERYKKSEDRRSLGMALGGLELLLEPG